MRPGLRSEGARCSAALRPPRRTSEIAASITRLVRSETRDLVGRPCVPTPVAPLNNTQHVTARVSMRASGAHANHPRNAPRVILLSACSVVQRRFRGVSERRFHLFRYLGGGDNRPLPSPPPNAWTETAKSSDRSALVRRRTIYYARSHRNEIFISRRRFRPSPVVDLFLLCFSFLGKSTPRR